MPKTLATMQQHVKLQGANGTVAKLQGALKRWLRPRKVALLPALLETQSALNSCSFFEGGNGILFCETKIVKPNVWASYCGILVLYLMVSTPYIFAVHRHMEHNRLCPKHLKLSAFSPSKNTGLA